MTPCSTFGGHWERCPYSRSLGEGLGQLAGPVNPSAHFFSVAQLMAAVKDTLSHDYVLHNDEPCTLRKAMEWTEWYWGTEFEHPARTLKPSSSGWACLLQWGLLSPAFIFQGCPVWLTCHFLQEAWLLRLTVSL